MQIHIPTDKREEALIKALYILGNYLNAQKIYDNHLGFEARKLKAHWTKEAETFLEDIGYIKEKTNGKF